MSIPWRLIKFNRSHKPVTPALYGLFCNKFRSLWYTSDNIHMYKGKYSWWSPLISQWFWAFTTEISPERVFHCKMDHAEVMASRGMWPVSLSERRITRPLGNMLIHVMLPWFTDIRSQASGGNCIALYLIHSTALFEQCMCAMGFEQCMRAMGFEPKKTLNITINVCTCN